MENLNKEGIGKVKDGLRRCAGTGSCVRCAYHDKGSCCYRLMRDALQTIEFYESVLENVQRFQAR